MTGNPLIMEADQGILHLRDKAILHQEDRQFIPQ